MFRLFKKKPQPQQEQPNFMWTTPPADILSDTQPHNGGLEYPGESIGDLITALGFPCEHVESTFGASVARHHYNFAGEPRPEKIKRIGQKVGMQAHCHVDAAPSDRAHFCLTMPRKNRQTVGIKSAMLTHEFCGMPAGLSACLGTDTSNKAVCISIEKMPHLLIAGATGSGKSVCLNSIINSILFKSTPSHTRLLLIDPKQVEMSLYEGLPHLMRPIVKDVRSAVQALKDVCEIMDTRYSEMSARGQKNVSETDYPRILVVVDELADLMLTSKSAVEKSIVRIAQLGRAAGVHLIVATQRPTVNVITGLIKANIPARIALQTASVRDSMVILDHKGAESLTGKGDALLKLPDRVDTIRFQTAYISDNDIASVVDYWTSDTCKRPSRS